MPEEPVERNRVVPLAERDSQERVGGDLADLVEGRHREGVVEAWQLVFEKITQRPFRGRLHEPLEGRL